MLRNSGWRGIPLAFLLLSTACSSTRLSSEWRDTNDADDVPQKLAVAVVVKDDSISRLIEEEAVHRLPGSTHAVAARQLGFMPGADIQALRDTLHTINLDAIVITRLIAIDEHEIYHPPQSYFVDNRLMLSPYYRDFWRFYPYTASVAVAPAYKTIGTRFITETILYRLPEGKPVRAAVVETLNPNSTLTLVNEIVRVVQKQIGRAGPIDAR